MPKNDKSIGSKPSKMTVMLFQLEGNDETIQEGFRTINNAIEKLVNPVVRVIAAPNGGTAVLPLGISKSGDAGPVVDVMAEETLDDEVKTTSSKAPKSGLARKLPMPAIIELELTKGEQPLKEYLEQKKPTSDIRKYLLIAAWLKENLGIDEVGINHIYTCYRAMEWQVPDDVAAPLRSMKRKQYGYFNAGKERGLFAINHIGLGKASSNQE